MNFNDYENYKNSSFRHRRFTHNTILRELDKLKSNQKLSIEIVGYSVEKRAIHLVRYGTGKTSIFLWSQMHGNEATATAAIFDILNFLCSDDLYNPLRKSISENLSLYFMPMVNPDGAELFQRENALNVDLNRDAIRESMPETKVLKDVHNKIKPDIGFNLHDQRTHYNVKNSSKTATISFLAPAYNEEKDINANREKAMKYIAILRNYCEEFIPGHIARYDDSYGERCIGDMFQAQGTSVILIESGAYKNDPERKLPRKLNAYALIRFFEELSSDNFPILSTKDYFSIPENDGKMFDVLLRNVMIEKNESSLIVDIGLRIEEFTNLKNRKFETETFIEEIGDLKNCFGIEEIDVENYNFRFGKIWNDEIPNDISDNKAFQIELIKNGYTALLGQETTYLRNVQHFPYQFKLESAMDYLLYKDNELHIAIINNHIFHLKEMSGT